jgi:predicted nucleic acid-binding protein
MGRRSRRRRSDWTDWSELRVWTRRIVCAGERLVKLIEAAEWDRGVLFATDLLVWVQRGSASAASAIDERPIRRISIVTYMEMLQSTTTRLERAYVSNFLESFRFLVLPLTENISHRAAVYVEQYAITIADGLLAAMAMEHALPIVTCSRDIFGPIVGLEVELVGL